MKRATLTSARTKLLCFFILAFTILLFTQCRKDEEENFRIKIENNCDFGIKVYYDNQDIENSDEDCQDVDIIGSVTVIPPHSSKTLYSYYSYVWIESINEDAIGKKFKSDNDGPFRKILTVYEEDFYPL